MYSWFNGPGKAFRTPRPGTTNYLSAYERDGVYRDDGAKGREQNDDEGEEREQADVDEADESKGQGSDNAGRNGRQQRIGILRPYPQNPYFYSQNVLSEKLRDDIYNMIVRDKRSVAAVSTHFKVDMRRVGAVVRLKTIEKDWEAQGRPLAKAYASAVLAMLPQTTSYMHENINDLPVHPATHQQIFLPTSESRHFTRQDAARIFSPTLLPADARIPHPEMIEEARDAASELTRRERFERAEARRAKAGADKEKKEEKAKRWEEMNVKVVQGARWDFRFESIKVEDVGRDGRGAKGTGWRYGMPLEDRKRGHHKVVPLSVPA